MAEQKACTVFTNRESRSFNLRLNNSATKHLSGDECVDIDVPLPAGAPFRCTAKYWPNWLSSGHIKIAVLIARADDQQRYRLLASHIDLPSRTGLTPPPVTVRRETVTAADCSEGGMAVRRDPAAVTADCKEGGGGGGTVKREPVAGAAATTDCWKEGVSLMAKRVDVEAKCVVEDHFTAICTVAVSKAWPPLPLPAPSRLELDILKTSDLTDVAFHVDGETFRAHRLVLAARSPVFRAELFGQTAEPDKGHHHQQQQQPASSPTAIIQVPDMKASTFRSMLHYMYHGLLPAPETEADCQVSEFQNLYVAADEYGLDTLRQTCEEILCAGVSRGTVLSNFVFAEEHACLKLKSRCLDFLAVGENFKAVAVTNEYIDLMKEEPALLDHVQNRFKRPRLS